MAIFGMLLLVLILGSLVGTYWQFFLGFVIFSVIYKEWCDYRDYRRTREIRRNLHWTK